MKTKINAKIKSETKWSSIFPKESLKWEKIHSQPQKSTIDMKLRSFQYKYIMRILPTNQSLFHFKISESSLCCFCNMQVETLEHLFWECKHVQHLWNRLGKFLIDKKLIFLLNLKTICF